MSLTSGTRFIGISENVNLKERKSAVINAETQPFTAQDIANFIGPGATGPQGVQGPAGPLGPVGPAGLNWQGAWVSGTSYVADDAVGYDGASWFCILATSGTTNPDVDTTHWALLASQGAQGIQGVQGPTGPQGAGATQTLQQTVDLGNTVTDGSFTTSIFPGFINVNYGSSSVDLYYNSLVFTEGSGSIELRNPNTITGVRTITLPDASGTVALTSQLPGNSTVGSKTATVSFPVLTADINTVTTSGVGRGVILPTTTVIGKEIIVYANNNAYSFAIKADSIDSAKISITGISSNISQVDVKPNENYKFTALSGGYWKAEAIGASLQQVANVGNIITGGTNKTTLSGNSALVSNIATPTTAVEISSNAIYLNKGGTSTSIVLPSTVTGDHVYTLPNASGNLALQSYKVWRAKIDTSSVITVLSDEIGFTSPVITNPSNGKILITKTGFFTGINAAKIDLITSTVNNSGTPFVCTLERYNIALNNSIILNVFDMDGTQTGTPSTTFTVEIRIYN